MDKIAKKMHENLIKSGYNKDLVYEFINQVIGSISPLMIPKAIAKEIKTDAVIVNELFLVLLAQGFVHHYVVPCYKEELFLNHKTLGFKLPATLIVKDKNGKAINEDDLDLISGYQLITATL